MDIKNTQQIDFVKKESRENSPGQKIAKSLKQDGGSSATERSARDVPPEPKVELKVEKQFNTGIRFEIDKSLDIVVAKLVDKETGEVIRQVPPEEMLAIAKKLKMKKGVFLNKEV